MLVRLCVWWDSPYGLLAPDTEVEVEGPEAVRLVASHLAEPVREQGEVAVVVPAERAVRTTKRKAKRGKQ